jgi:hypothetical protein
MEFLVDRFGYVRARGFLAEANSGPAWAAQIEALAVEPRVRPPPDDHVH